MREESGEEAHALVFKVVSQTSERDANRAAPLFSGSVHETKIPIESNLRMCQFKEHSLNLPRLKLSSVTHFTYLKNVGNLFRAPD